MSGPLNGKAALVTGASSGIGHATALALASMRVLRWPSPRAGWTASPSSRRRSALAAWTR